jgi:hypothetical protein
MSTIRVNAIQNTSGVEQYTCKAWVNFSGAGTVTIRASGNVTSITDNGVGNFTLNFTTAFANTNYAVTGFARSDVSQVAVVSSYASDTKTTSAFQVRGIFPSNSPVDWPEIGIAVFR